MDIATVIVAAGSGSRFGGSLPKQFLMLEGKPVLCHSIDTFRGTFPEAPIVLVLSDEGRLWWDEFCRTTGYISPVVAPGGATRADSVLSGIAALEKTTDNTDTIVMIHDGARPLATHRLLLSLAEAASAPGADGAVPAAPMADSMVSIAADGTISCPQRSGFRRVQTPQVFKLARLLHAHRAVADHAAFTDDLSVMIAAGHSAIRLVDSDDTNLKITTPADLRTAQAIIQSRS